MLYNMFSTPQSRFCSPFSALWGFFSTKKVGFNLENPDLLLYFTLHRNQKNENYEKKTISINF